MRQWNHPLIREDSHNQFTRGSSGELKVSVGVFTNCLLLNIIFLSPSPFQPLPYLWSLSLVCLLLPLLLLLLLFFTCAAGGFALGELLCCLNFMQQIWKIRKCEQNDILLYLASAEKMFYLIQRDLEMHLLNTRRSERCRLFSNWRVSSSQQNWISHIQYRKTRW